MFAQLLQPSHLVVILLVLFFFFGGRWAASLGGGFKEAVRNFRSALRKS